MNSDQNKDAKAGEPNMSVLLRVGDIVKIVKPETISTKHWFRWIGSMDMYDGAETHVIKILPMPEDQDIQAYDLDIDDGEFGWLHSFLQPIKHA